MAMMPECSRPSAPNGSDRDSVGHQLMMTGHWHPSEMGDSGRLEASGEVYWMGWISGLHVDGSKRSFTQWWGPFNWS